MHRTNVLAMSLATLLLAVILIVAIHGSPRRSAGFRVQAAANTCDCNQDDYQTIVLHVSSGTVASINSEPVQQTRLANRLRAIYSTRAVRIIYLSAEDDLSFQHVADVMDIIQGLRVESGQGFPVPKELRGLPESMNIGIRLVTTRAINAPCPKNCINWAKQGLPISY